MRLPFKFHVGHTVVLIDAYGREDRYYVREIRSEGWMLEPYGREGERRYFSGDQIRLAYLGACMRYEPWDDDTIPAARRRRLRESFVALPAVTRLRALRKLAIVRAVEKATAGGMAKGAALKGVPKQLLATVGDEWHRDDVERARDAYRLREEKGLLGDGEHFEEPPRYKTPGERTVWGWMQAYVESGRSVNALVDDHAAKGRRESQLTTAQDEELATFFKDHLPRRGGFEPAAAFKEITRILKGKKIPEIGRRTFKRRLKREFDRRGMAELTYGRRAARREGAISSNGATPLWPLHQVESDHVLLNLKVVDPETGIDLGRPWLTAFKDRFTGEPTGLHVSFLPPSWATLSRGLAHSMWPKDLARYPELVNPWLAEGVLDECITDRGMDYISKAGRAAAVEMKFEILNLPGYMPWLKGGLERWNREVKAEILTMRDGVTSFKNPEYRGKNHPTITVEELTASLLKWVVDSYISDGEERFDGMSRNEIWLEQLDRHGPPRPVEDFDRFRRMTMIPDKRTIQNYGVEVGGFFYRDERGKLAELRKKHGNEGRFWDILIDPWDTGYIELNDGGSWILLLNECAEMRGVSRYRSEFYWDHAKDVAAGKAPTIEQFLRAREAVDDDAARVLAAGRNSRRGSQNMLGRFLDVGRFATPVPLRLTRFAPEPVSVPGMVERNGVLRPAWRPQATVQATPVAPSLPKASGTNGVPPGGTKSAPATGAKPSPTTAPEPQDIMARLAAAARERTSQLGAGS